MMRALLMVGALGAAALGVAPQASAHSAGLIKTLAANGEDVSTQEIRYAAIDLGQAICGDFDATQNPNTTVDYLISLGHTKANANMWLAASVLYLCPQLNYLTHYATNR